VQDLAITSAALLMIDGDARVRAAITALLKVALPALPVVEAANAPEALELVRTRSFGVILVDAVQPSPGSDASLISYLRRTTGSIIIATGTRRHHRSAAHEAGAHEFISKAASADILLPIIQWAGENGMVPKPASNNTCGLPGI
jgi:DNA-binding NarL/FixJ family response regulator